MNYCIVRIYYVTQKYTCIPLLSNNVRFFCYFVSIFMGPAAWFCRANSFKKLSLVNCSVYAYKLWLSNAFNVFEEPLLHMYKVLYSTMLQLPPLKFHCVERCWDCYDFVIGGQTLYAKISLWLLVTCLNHVCLLSFHRTISYCLVHAWLNHFLLPCTRFTKPFLVA